MKELALNAAMLAAWMFPTWGAVAYLAARFGLIKGVELRPRNSLPTWAAFMVVISIVFIQVVMHEHRAEKDSPAVVATSAE